MSNMLFDSTSQLRKELLVERFTSEGRCKQRH